MIDVPISEARSITPIAGYPSVSVPSGMDLNGLPTSLYFYGEQGSDHQLLAMAYAYEQLNPARQNPLFKSYEKNMNWDSRVKTVLKRQRQLVDPTA